MLQVEARGIKEDEEEEEVTRLVTSAQMRAVLL
jgi:hypothetical protein